MQQYNPVTNALQSNRINIQCSAKHTWYTLKPPYTDPTFFPLARTPINNSTRPVRR